MIATATTARNIQLVVETINASRTGITIAYHVDHQKSRHCTTVSVYWSWWVLSMCVHSIIPEYTAYNAPVAEISASVQNPRLFRSKRI